MGFKRLRPVCGVTRRWLCPCLFGEKFSRLRPQFLPIMDEWQQVELEVVSIIISKSSLVSSIIIEIT